jgi:hypothetical protein
MREYLNFLEMAQFTDQDLWICTKISSFVHRDTIQDLITLIDLGQKLSKSLIVEYCPDAGSKDHGPRDDGKHSRMGSK